MIITTQAISKHDLRNIKIKKYRDFEIRPGTQNPEDTQLDVRRKLNKHAFVWIYRFFVLSDFVFNQKCFMG